MIKCNVTVCGTISKAAVVRTNNENKAFTAFAVNCVIPARNGINKTVEISVGFIGQPYRGFKRGFHQGRNAFPWKDRQEHRGEDR